MESIRDRIGHYELIEEISRSSTTSVFKAYQKNLDRWVLLKQLHSHLTQEEDIVQRFEREAKAAARIKHENIVDIYDFGLWEDIYYIALEFVEGTSLRAVLREKTRLPLSIAVPITHAILTGLSFAHSKGVFHRDMKPDNILISKTGTVKITDFGLAIIRDYPSITAQDGIVGTPAYMSPEQANGVDIDARSDIFSLGLTFYELLTGRRAYDGDSFSVCITKLLTEDPPRIEDLRPDIPKDVASILSRMMKKDVGKRYQSCEEIIDDLEQCEVLSDGIPTKDDLAIFLGSTQEPPAVLPEQRSQTGRKMRRGLPVAAAAILLAIIIGSYIIISGRPVSHTERDASREGIGTVDSSLTPLPSAIDTVAALTDNSEESQEDPHSPVIGNRDPDSTREADDQHSTQSSDTTALSSSDPRGESDVRVEENRTPEEDIIPPVVIEPMAPGSLVINSIPWADLTINNRSAGDTPLKPGIELESGLHSVIFNNPYFQPYMETVEIRPGEKTVMNVTFVGFLLVDAHPWAFVFLNGDTLGLTPITKPVMLWPDEYALRLENPKCEIHEQRITITKAETLEVALNLVLLPEN